MLRPVSVVLAMSWLGLAISPALTQMLPPAISQDGHTVAFGTTVEPDGTRENVSDIWLWGGAEWFTHLNRLTNFAGSGATNGVTDLALSADGSKVAYIAFAPGSSQFDEVHLWDASSGSDRLLTRDTQGCVQPAIACVNINCSFPCVHQPHITPDGGVLYAASRNQPLYVVTSAGNVTQLPTYSGTLAAGPQRVISSNGLVIFTSSAPAGPTFAAAAMDVYVMNLDGTGIRNLTHFNNATVLAQNAVISADGRTIAFESNYGLQNTSTWPQIFVAGSDGSGLRQVTTGPDTAGNPSLSADGSLLAFVQSGQIQLLHTTGNSPAAALTNFTYSTAGDPALSDDGSQVAFTIGPPHSGRGAIYQTATNGGTPGPVFAPVSLNPSGIFGVAGDEPPSPGSLISAYGLNFSNDQLTVARSYPLTGTLAGVSLLANGQPLPLSSVSPWQINAQIPQDTPVGNTTIQVTSAGAAANTVTAKIQASGPAVFAFLSQGVWQAAAFHAGTATPADALHPAAAGETLETYGSGLGLTDPPVAAGEPSPASPPASASAVPQVTIGDQPAKVTFAGLAPGFAGVYQTNVIVPAGLPPGSQRLVWTWDNRGAVIFVK